MRNLRDRYRHSGGPLAARRGGGAPDPWAPLKATSPLWAVAAASGQTGDAIVGTQTWQAGAADTSGTDDPTFTAGTRAYWGCDGDDFVEIFGGSQLPTLGTSDEFTMMVVCQAAATPGTSARIMSAQSSGASTAGWYIELQTTGSIRMGVHDGTSSALNTGVVVTGMYNTIKVAFGFTSGGAAQFTTRVNGTTRATLTSRPANPQTPTIAGGRIARLGCNSYAVTNTFTGRIYAAAAWQRQLTTDEMAALETFFGAGT